MLLRIEVIDHEGPEKYNNTEMTYVVTFCRCHSST